jgi:hypothetical protein
MAWRLFIPEHRHREKGAGTGKFHEGDEARVALDIVGLRHEVGDVNNVFGCGEAGEGVARIVSYSQNWSMTPPLGIG